VKIFTLQFHSFLLFALEVQEFSPNISNGGGASEFIQIWKRIET